MYFCIFENTNKPENLYFLIISIIEFRLSSSDSINYARTTDVAKLLEALAE